MRTYSLCPTLVLILACLLAIVLFLLGVAGPGGHFWGRFLLPIVLVFLWGRPRDIYIVTALASVLVVATYWNDDVNTLDDLVTNHVLPIAILWAAAWLLAQRQRMQKQLARREQELDELVKARTAELGTSEQRYRLLTQNSRDLVWAFDLHGRMTYVSPAATKMAGIAPEEILQMSWEQQLAPPYVTLVTEAVEAALSALTSGEPVHGGPFVVAYKCKDGSTIWTETVFNALYDDASRPIGLCGSTRDISLRHAAEAALHRSQEQIAKIFRANPGGITITRQSDDCFLEANDAYLATVGYTRKELIGRTIVELGILPSESRARVMAAFQEQGYLRGLDLQLTNARGEPIDIFYSSEQIEFNGELCYLTLVVDITERKRLEQALQALNAELEDRITGAHGRPAGGNRQPSAGRPT